MPSDSSQKCRKAAGYSLVSPSSQLPDVGVEGHVLHRGLQVVQIVLIKWLSNHTQKISDHGSLNLTVQGIRPDSTEAMREAKLGLH